MFGFVVIEVMTLSGHPLIINKIESLPWGHKSHTTWGVELCSKKPRKNQLKE